ncbi:protein HtrL-like [Physella acuta]|uniref:protein HtrL-like n=1 Tax=Physella acuta TaxID=109671 RepID=UPI0027DB947E|nr:protein HtrL-like [Physella acuta]
MKILVPNFKLIAVVGLCIVLGILIYTSEMLSKFQIQSEKSVPELVTASAPRQETIAVIYLDKNINEVKPGGGDKKVDVVTTTERPRVEADEEKMRKERLDKQLEELKALFGPEGNNTDLKMLYSWKGLGPEKGLYNFTVVTAMMDIGRGSWSNQSRPYKTYLLYMLRLLMMDINLVLFVDPQAATFVEWMRQGREHRTKVYLMVFKDLPYYKLKDRMREIMNSTEYKKDNELVRDKLCESYIPEYDILQLSKLYFMDRAARENPFKTTYFMWMDGGYGHGNNVYPPNNLWIPKGLFEYPNQVTFINRNPGVEHYRSVKDKIHKLSINILAGNFFSGGGENFKELYRLQQEQVGEWMEQGVVDDDQTMYMLIYYKKPSLFRLVTGDWYDVFKLFNAQQ